MTQDPGRAMKDFWDEKAKENAMYYISSYRPYDDQDPEEFWRWGEILTERFLGESRIPFTGGERVLEIGCGIGRMTAALARRFREVEGIDVSEEMVRRATEALAETPNVRVSVANGTDLATFGDRSFDFVFSYLVLQHIPDREITKRYLREAGRVLRPGGWMHVQVNGEGDAAPAAARPAPEGASLPAGLRRFTARAARAAKAILRGGRARPGPSGLDNPAWRGSRVTLAEVTGVCRDAGLEITRTEGEGTQYLWLTARKLAAS
jgi:SAM-dependent methyltransferase